MRCEFIGGAKYFVTFIDDCTRWCEVYFLSAKNKALEAFKVYKSHVENMTGLKIKYLQTDNGGEYCLSLTHFKIHLDSFLGESAPLSTKVKYWIGGFKQRHTSCQDEHRSHQSNEVARPETMKKIHKMILDDSRLKCAN
ncbi:hypothetical protein K1T71_002525 [Dendrolimus kikuchii]|uniref:Uncharacterized protein n=1 Tax=Dendrolimus kikuchii TaxID=765133 RepID=A0ACC1DCX8_9NEOP|nr:hypothetical protein K1T71_002525 [Dendrolimus kikuchii]